MAESSTRANFTSISIEEVQPWSRCQEKMPDDRRFRCGLAAAQYRMGRFQKEFLSKAAETLGRCDQNDPTRLALLAMTQHRLEEKDQARASLERLGLLKNTPLWTQTPDAEALFREAALLIEGRKDPTAN